MNLETAISSLDPFPQQEGDLLQKLATGRIGGIIDCFFAGEGFWESFSLE